MTFQAAVQQALLLVKRAANLYNLALILPPGNLPHLAMNTPQYRLPHATSTQPSANGARTIGNDATVNISKPIESVLPPARSDVSAPTQNANAPVHCNVMANMILRRTRRLRFSFIRQSPTLPPIWEPQQCNPIPPILALPRSPIMVAMIKHCLRWHLQQEMTNRTTT